jgi:hypothetical protein
MGDIKSCKKMIKPITKRERLLMKKAFDAARQETQMCRHDKDPISWVLKHGNFNDFLFKNKYKVK